MTVRVRQRAVVGRFARLALAVLVALAAVPPRPATAQGVYDVSASAQAMAAGTAAIPAPDFVDLFWDPGWDTGVGAEDRLTRNRLDGFVQALAASDYLAGTAQYEPAGTVQPGFLMGAAVDPRCGGGAAPVAVSPRPGGSLDTMIACEIGVLALDAQIFPGSLSSLVFNVFLPPATTSDGSSGGCPAGPGLEAYHDDAAGAAGWVVAYTVIPAGCYLPAHQPYLTPFQAVSLTLSHEMVEAVTDPMPQDGWVYRGPGSQALQRGAGTEVADLCKDLPWAPATLNGPVPTAGQPFRDGLVSAYWSNADGGCVFGFAGPGQGMATPVISGVRWSACGGPGDITVSGSGFGAAPAGLPSPGDTLFLRFQDLSRGWEAGYGGLSGGDAVTANYRLWSPTSIRLGGLAGGYGSGVWTAAPGDQVEVDVWNVQDGQEAEWQGVIPEVPQVTGVTPDHGPPIGGTPVAIGGCGFTGATVVSFGYANLLPCGPGGPGAPAASQACFQVQSDGAIAALSPSYCEGTVDVTVAGPGGESPVTSAYQFAYRPLVFRGQALGPELPCGRIETGPLQNPGGTPKSNGNPTPHGPGPGGGVVIAFGDMGAFGWAQQAVEGLASQGIVRGVAPGRFAPQAPVTRAQFAALLDRIFSLTAPSGPQAPADVPQSHWAFAAVQAASPFMAGGGSASSAFEPEAAVTRQDVAAAIVRILAQRQRVTVLGASAAQAVLAAVPDASGISADLQPLVATAIRYGIMRGFPDSSFQPGGSLTRAEAAVLLFRVERLF